MLEITALRVSYGGVPILHDVALRVGEGEFVSVVGPNGAGKTTLFNAISGVVPASSGSIRFAGTDLTTVAPARRAHLGVAHVPEGRQVFSSLTVRENLEMGAYTAAGRASWRRTQQSVYTWFPRLAERNNQLAGTLSGGEQQMLAIARGIASSPKLLMLDAPSMGLAPAIADEIFERILEIHRDARLSVLLVEQRVAEALHFADRAYVLENGRVVLEGKPDTLKNDDRIRRAYLGM